MSPADMAEIDEAMRIALSTGKDFTDLTMGRGGEDLASARRLSAAL